MVLRVAVAVVASVVDFMFVLDERTGICRLGGIVDQSESRGESLSRWWSREARAVGRALMIQTFEHASDCHGDRAVTATTFGTLGY